MNNRKSICSETMGKKWAIFRSKACPYASGILCGFPWANRMHEKQSNAQLRNLEDTNRMKTNRIHQMKTIPNRFSFLPAWIIYHDTGQAVLSFACIIHRFPSLLRHGCAFSAGQGQNNLKRGSVSNNFSRKCA